MDKKMLFDPLVTLNFDLWPPKSDRNSGINMTSLAELIDVVVVLNQNNNLSAVPIATV